MTTTNNTTPDSSQPAFVQRMIAEEKELNRNMDKLHAFIHNSNMFKQLPFKEKYLLKKQLCVMRKYDGILLTRIGLYPKPIEQTKDTKAEDNCKCGNVYTTAATDAIPSTEDDITKAVTVLGNTAKIYASHSVYDDKKDKVIKKKPIKKSKNDKSKEN